MGTFIGQLAGFGVIVWLVVRYVVPPVRRLMTARQETVRQQLKESAAAVDRLVGAADEVLPAPVEAAADEKPRGPSLPSGSPTRKVTLKPIRIAFDAAVEKLVTGSEAVEQARPAATRAEDHRKFPRRRRADPQQSGRFERGPRDPAAFYWHPCPASASPLSPRRPKVA